MPRTPAKKARKARVALWRSAVKGLFSPEDCVTVREKLAGNVTSKTAEECMIDAESRAIRLQDSVNTADKLNKEALEKPFSGQFESNRRKH